MNVRIWLRRHLRWRQNEQMAGTKRQRFEIISVVLLYSIAGLSFFVGAIYSNEWVHRAVSTTFLVTVVVVPLFSIAVAFGIQIIALLREAREREENHRQEAHFLAALDKCRGKSIVGRNFLGHLLDQWDVQMSKLSRGVVSVQEGYWSVCIELYGLAVKLVECTSSIPIDYWDDNTELLKYKDIQKERLVNRGVCVRRTFILDSLTPSRELTKFLDIAISQLHEGFYIYYIDLSAVRDDAIRQLLSTDFALIDDLILMLGRQSNMNKGVYYYDFFELALAGANVSEYEPALALMSNRAAFMEGSPPQVHISTHRKRLDELPLLNDKNYETHKLAIMQKAHQLKRW